MKNVERTENARAATARAKVLYNTVECAQNLRNKSVQETTGACIQTNPHVTQILEHVNLGVKVEVQKLLKRVHGLTSRSGVYILVGMTAGLTPTANPQANYRVI